MKRLGLWGLLAAALCLLIVLFLRKDEAPTLTLEPIRPQEAISNSTVEAKPSLSTEEKLQEIRNAAELKREQQIKAREQAYDVPIEFYGRVVDQNGRAIEGVIVTARVNQIKTFSTNEPEKHQSMTDASGKFYFHGLKGASVNIWLEKQGYEFKSDGKMFAYSKIAAIPGTASKATDSQKPAVFTLWKMKGAEPLYHGTAYVRVPVDGKPVRVDLITGREVASGGDIIFSIKRESKDFNPGQKFDWQATLEAVDGGFIKAGDGYTNEAPESGYQPKISINIKTTDSNWNDSYEGQFYIKSQSGGHYGRIKLQIIAGMQPPPVAVDIDAFINPSGSRNLEFDPAKQILNMETSP